MIKRVYTFFPFLRTVHLSPHALGDKWTTTLGTKAWRKTESKTSNNTCTPAAKSYQFEHCWTEEHYGKPEGMGEAS